MSRDTLPAVALVFLMLLAPLSLAANDPGHDSLYVLRVGDTNITGSINLTGNISAYLVQVSTRFFGPNLDIRGDGTSSAAITRIVATSTDLELSTAAGGILLEKDGGTVYVGQTGTSATLNVTGTIYENNVRLCLANGTNCPSSLGSANITGNGGAGYLGRWTSTSNLASSVIYDDGTNVGVGTATITQRLTVNGGGNFTAGNVALASTYSLCFNAACTARVYHNGTALIIEGQ